MRNHIFTCISFQCENRNYLSRNEFCKANEHSSMERSTLYIREAESLHKDPGKKSWWWSQCSGVNTLFSCGTGTPYGHHFMSCLSIFDSAPYLRHGKTAVDDPNPQAPASKWKPGKHLQEPGFRSAQRQPLVVKQQVEKSFFLSFCFSL